MGKSCKMECGAEHKSLYLVTVQHFGSRSSFSLQATLDQGETQRDMRDVCLLLLLP